MNGRQVGEYSCETISLSMDVIRVSPFSFDITDLLRGDGTDSLAVRVHNAERAGGIYAPVYVVLSDTPLDFGHQANAVALAVPGAHRQAVLQR